MTLSIAHLGYGDCLLKVATSVYYLPGLNGSCSSANQPKGICKEAYYKTLWALAVSQCTIVIIIKTEDSSLILLKNVELSKLDCQNWRSFHFAQSRWVMMTKGRWLLNLPALSTFSMIPISVVVPILWQMSADICWNKMGNPSNGTAPKNWAYMVYINRPNVTTSCQNTQSQPILAFGSLKWPDSLSYLTDWLHFWNNNGQLPLDLVVLLALWPPIRNFSKEEEEIWLLLTCWLCRR